MGVNGMKESYKSIGDFLDDAHELISVKQLAMDMGIFTKDDFRGQLVKCCFHNDDTPSLQIGEKFFRCYAGSCGVKGDAIGFVQTYLNIGFVDAVRKIADVYGIDVSDIKMKFDGKADALKHEWNAYLHHMESAPKSAQELQRDFFPQQVGFDPKMGYVVLPFTSKTGQILGFTKRRVDALHHKDENGRWDCAKWWHSTIADSLISQCHNVFNLHGAAPAVRREQAVVVNEGPKDVIAWQRVGIEHAVGVCGTSNSNNIWDAILPVEKVYLSMDGDITGVKTVVKNILFLVKRHDLDTILCVPMPDGMDPYDVLMDKNMGAEKLLELYNHPVEAADFVVMHGQVDDVANLFESVPEHSKLVVLKSICKVKHYSVNEAQSWIKSGNITHQSEQLGDEKEQLLAVVKGDGDGSMLPDKAAKILKMKFGIKVEEVC